MAREEKFKLDGDREELKSIKLQLDNLKSCSANMSQHILNSPLTSPQNKSVVLEVKRIEKEISDLLKGRFLISILVFIISQRKKEIVCVCVRERESMCVDERV